MPKKRFFGGIALIAACAAGCGMANASPEHVSVPAEPTMIDFIDPSTVPGLTTSTITEGEEGERYVHAIYPDLADAPKLTARLKTEVVKQLDDFKKATTPTGRPPRPEINVDWQLAAVGDRVIGVRLRTGEFYGANWGNSTKTLWYDRQTQRTLDSTDLLEDPDALVTLVRKQLDKRGSEIDHGEVRPDDELFDSMAFNPEGDLVVEFDDCEVGPCSLGRVAVAVPEEQARPLLSAVGRHAQDTARAAATQAPDPTMTASKSPAAVSKQAGSVDCRQAKCVALTFDDGPGPYTARLLDELGKGNARATFFTVGTNASVDPQLIRRMSDEGHLVANHSWAHRDLAKLSSSKITDSLGRTQDTLTAAIGQTPTLVRPPYGAVSKDVKTVAGKLGLSLVNWNVDTMDWRDRNPKVVERRAVDGARPGAIILMHDIHRTTVDAVPAILKRLRGKGYTFVTVPELYGAEGMQAGRLYTAGP